MVGLRLLLFASLLLGYSRVQGSEVLGRIHPNDPLWKDMWYLHDEQYPSMNIRKAWKDGYTGEGVVITVIDDGLERDHPDIAPNYDADASYDFNANDTDPTPRYTYNNENRHGTRFAGIISAQANNSVCIVGVAYGSHIGGIRMLDGNVNDEIEAQSFGFANDHIDIYAGAFGPDDNGRTVEGPQVLAEQAIERAINQGRNGKGNIIVWASGNGGRNKDDCNCDGYANSMYTIAIGSVSVQGTKPWYGEECPAILASTYSSGVASGNKNIATIDIRSRCTTQHTGNGGAVGLAAGIIALALQANPELTWRDMQHLIVRTANMDGLHGEVAANAVGRNYSRAFGYGLMDAHAMVQEAKSWENVPEQRVCRITIKPSTSTDWNLNYRSPKIVRVLAKDTACDDGGELPDKLEHVQLTLNTIRMLSYTQLTVSLTSPSNTTSKLVGERIRDNYYKGYKDWNLMSVQFWDENPTGMWEIEFFRTEYTGLINEPLILNLYGTMDADWESREITTAAQETEESFMDKKIRMAKYVACVMKCRIDSFINQQESECDCQY